MNLPRMACISSRRTWSQSEDEKLITLVGRLGDRRGRGNKWKEVSENLPGRTNKDCRKRWFHSLDPSLRKGRWTKEEDRLLLDAYHRMGPSWKYIALFISGRKDDQCAKRYNEILNPHVQHRLKSWKPEEDQYLTSKVTELGHKWSVIATGLPGRPPLTCRNRWRRLARDMNNDVETPVTDSTELQSSAGTTHSFSYEPSEPSPGFSRAAAHGTACSNAPGSAGQISPIGATSDIPSMNLPASKMDFFDYLQSPGQGMTQNSHGFSASQLPSQGDMGVFGEINERDYEIFPHETSGNNFLNLAQSTNSLEDSTVSEMADSATNAALDDESMQQVLFSFLQDADTSAHMPETNDLQQQNIHYTHHIHIHHHHYHHHYNH